MGKNFIRSHVWKAGTGGYVVAIVVLMQEWTIVKEIIIHKMYLLRVSFYLLSPGTS
jgi:hypothetical protein